MIDDDNFLNPDMYSADRTDSFQQAFNEFTGSGVGFSNTKASQKGRNIFMQAYGSQIQEAGAERESSDPGDILKTEEDEVFKFHW